jgi:hypothetical protein
MKKLFGVLFVIMSSSAMALHCNCEVIVHSPISGPNKLQPDNLKQYHLESYDSYKVKNQYACRHACLETFHHDLPTARLNALLVKYSKNLIDVRSLGFNCTGLSTLKYPVRVRASLGRLGLGNVIDQVHVINHEEACFN